MMTINNKTVNVSTTSLLVTRADVMFKQFERSPKVSLQSSGGTVSDKSIDCIRAQ